jgi:large subunit ribosomal protein L21
MMYAVVEIAGQQFKVAPQEKIRVPSLAGKAGDGVTFDRVLLLGDDSSVTVGTPLVSNASVRGTILEHGRADKVTVFKKKRRKGYRVTRGHRQGYTRVEITSIGK